MKKTFEDGMDDISNFLHSTTSIRIKNSIVLVLRRLRTNTTTPITQAGVYSETIICQQKIGLKATLNGCWTKEWIGLQKDYYKENKSRCSPNKWLTDLSLQIQQAIYSLWKTRNEALHHQEDAAGNKIEHEKINNTIREFFDQVPNLRLLPPCDAAYFGRGMKRILDYRLPRKKKWIEDAQRILDSFRLTLDASSESFLDYFTNT